MTMKNQNTPEGRLTDEQLQDISDGNLSCNFGDCAAPDMATDLLASRAEVERLRARVKELEGFNDAMQELNALMRPKVLPQTLEIKRLTAENAQLRALLNPTPQYIKDTGKEDTDE